ncbi:MAG: hypothetical protein LH649_00355 [Pseudanabaena sp. CAN_BIN31]|nr:hypothetical protein [Pseudanabaena sp. CAN_BIN31]
MGNVKLTIHISNLMGLILKLTIAQLAGAIAYLDVMYWLVLVLMIIILSSMFVLIVEVVAILHSLDPILVSAVSNSHNKTKFYNEN